MNLRGYIEEFNRNDTEYTVTDIDNAHCAEWLENEIPLFECSDKDLEKTYYFRWWVYRKHIKNTPEGYVITEFLPNVPWSGKYNVINAPAGHHLMEGRWLRNSELYLKDYINIFFKYPEIGMHYSTWLIWAAKKFNDVSDCLDVTQFLKNAVPYYESWEKAHKTETGLFWSIDDCDAMEYSISGSPHKKPIAGLRPTLNSYMYADAAAIYDFSRLNKAPMEEYLEKAEKIRLAMQKILWRDGFFKALHPQDGSFGRTAEMDTSKIPRELMGYIPWYFSIPKDGEAVFEWLEDENIFTAKQGLTTAEKTAENFMYEVNHECLWNGYVWPFATSQTLTALLNVIKKSKKNYKYSEMYYKLLLQYAKQHTRVTENGKEVMWIDEVKDPEKNLWTSRETLKAWGWPEDKGGFERGKDYNHSTFCDLVISYLTGVEIKDNEVKFNPVIPKELKYFQVDNLYIRGARYTVRYAQTAERYGKTGLCICKNGKEITTRGV